MYTKIIDFNNFTLNSVYSVPYKANTQANTQLKYTYQHPHTYPRHNINDKFTIRNFGTFLSAKRNVIFIYRKNGIILFFLSWNAFLKNLFIWVETRFQSIFPMEHWSAISFLNFNNKSCEICHQTCANDKIRSKVNAQILLTFKFVKEFWFFLHYFS